MAPEYQKVRSANPLSPGARANAPDVVVAREETQEAPQARSHVIETTSTMRPTGAAMGNFPALGYLRFLDWLNWRLTRAPVFSFCLF